MKKRILPALILLFFSGLSIAQISISDIQFTTNSGNGTYPSLLEGQYLNAGGIVTATGYNYDNYFISSSNGGAWQGLFIYDNNFSPAIGDSISFQGKVTEYQRLTEMKNLSDFQIISSSNPIPAPEVVSTYDVSTNEAYEGVLVEISNSTVSQTYNEWNDWEINDGSGSCIINNAIFNLQSINFPLIPGYPFSSIKGVVTYAYETFRLLPRNIDDIQSSPGNSIFSLNNTTVHKLTEFEYPVYLSFLGQSLADNFEFILPYDTTKLEYTGFNQDGSLSSGGTVNDLSVQGQVHLGFSGTFSFSGVEELIKLNFISIDTLSSTIEFLSGSLDGNPVQWFSSGQIDVFTGGKPLGDTLTVIQKPILNIPEIVVPGEEFEIMCLAPSTTVDWQASLVYENNTIPLPIIQSNYNPDVERWYLTAIAPQPAIYELYDLLVSASGNIADTTANAVCLIPQEKDSYYFVQITDTHLPTHDYYPDPISATDTSEIVDLREVIHDVNLIHPEFVLLTGDLINEGELEDFENRRYFSIAQRLMKEFDVPVYLVSGNHDIGGWPATPVPDGSARHNWWNFFGWKWLENPPAGNPYYTQNYSFDYGNTHYVGMEAYINYDGFMENIYGGTSFTPSQLAWLDNDLLNTPTNISKVLFYHMDFADQINLSTMAVDMALYGHIHHDEGEINAPPYNLATDNVCDGDRAYRVIRVHNGVLQALNTSHAGDSGENLEIEFFPANNGQADSVAAQITNNQDIDFDQARIKFLMPKGNFNYHVTNGILDQVDSSGNYAVCYVHVDIPADGILEVSVKLDASNGIDSNSEATPCKLYQNFPNPFADKTSITYYLASNDDVELSVFNLSGQLLWTQTKEKEQAGYHVLPLKLSAIMKANNNSVLILRLKTGSGYEDHIQMIFLP